MEILAKKKSQLNFENENLVKSPLPKKIDSSLERPLMMIEKGLEYKDKVKILR